MSRKNSRESSPDSVSASSKDREKRRSRKNSICDTDDEDDIEDPNGNILYSTESEKDPRLLRDVSPSAQSHHSSSGTGVALEWDPSADVGAQTQVPSNTPVHQALQQSQNRSQFKARLHDIESGDLSALDQIVLALNYGYDLRPYVAESRSQRFDNVNDNVSHRNSTGSGTSDGQGHPSSLPVLTLSSSKGTSSEASNNSNSSYKTATETDPDQCNNNLRDPTPNVSDMTNASWQTTGLTRSEIKYMKRKQESSSNQSQSSSSILWVEVNAEEDGDDKNDSNTNLSQVSRPQDRDTTTASEINGDTTSTPSFSKKSVGIQTKVKGGERGGVLSTNQESQCQNENEPKPILNEQKSKMKSKRIQVSENIKTRATLVSQAQVFGIHRGRKNQDKTNDTDDFDPLSSSSGGAAISAEAAVAVAAAAYFSSNGVRKHDNMAEPGSGVQSQRHTVSVTGPGSGRSLKSHPSKSSVNVRRGNRINNGNSNSHGESSGQSSGAGISNLDSSDHLTPTCALLDKIITDGNATMRNYGYDVLEQHRNSLVYKMRKEFQHLERLNKILLEKRQGPSRSGAGSGSQRLTVETSVSTSDTSSGSRNHGGAHQDQKITTKSKLPQPRQVLVSSSQTPNSSSDSRGDNNIRIQIKQSRRPEIPLAKPVRGKEAGKKSRAKNEVYEFKKPLSYFLPFTSGPGFNSNRVIPSMEPRTSASRKGSNSNGVPRNGGLRTVGVGPSADEESNGEEEKENDIPPPIRDPQEGEDQGQQGDNVDLYGGIAGGYVLFENELVQISLQQAFTHYCPTVMTSVQQREYLLAQLKQEREFKAQVKRNYFQERQNCLSPNDSLNKAFPAKETRLMSTKEMRHLTEKKLKKLPEVQDKVIRRRLEEDKKTNRILSQVFSRKLRQHVLKGDMNIVHSKNLIRH